MSYFKKLLLYITIFILTRTIVFTQSVDTNQIIESTPSVFGNILENQDKYILTHSINNDSNNLSGITRTEVNSIASRLPRKFWLFSMPLSGLLALYWLRKAITFSKK